MEQELAQELDWLCEQEQPLQQVQLVTLEVQVVNFELHRSSLTPYYNLRLVY